MRHSDGSPLPTSQRLQDEPRTDMTLRKALALFAADLERRLELHGQRPTSWRRMAALCAPGVLGVLQLRVGNWMHARGWRVATRLTERLIMLTTRNELQLGSQIGPGLVLPDQGTVGITARARIGSNCTFFPMATVIPTPEPDTTDDFGIGNHCVIGRKVRIYGPVKLGDGTQIKDNSVVLVSFAREGQVLSGVPARRRATVPVADVRRWNPLHGNAATRIREEEATTMSQSFSETRRLIHEDMVFRCQYENKPVSRLTSWKLMAHPGGASVVLYRWQCCFASNGLRFAELVARWLNLVLFTSDFSSQARIAGGFLVIHAVANKVDDGVAIGPRCVLFSQNAVSRSPFTDGVVGSEGAVPVIESDVVFGMGASAQGGVRVGAGSRIGMNTLVDTSVAPGSILLGVPARVTGQVASAAR